jgi:glycogen(starch) synthase
MPSSAKNIKFIHRKAVKKLRIFYAAGPGNVIGTYLHWKKKEEDPSLLGYTDSSQFYDLIKEIGAESLIIASHHQKKSLQDGPFTILHIPQNCGKGLLFHLFYLLYGLRITYHILRFKSNVAIIDIGTSYWFIWKLVSLFGVKVVPSLKCALWPQFLPLDTKQKMINFLDKGFFQKDTLAVLSISQVNTEQVKTLTNGKHAPFIYFLPFYDRNLFTGIATPNHHVRPFRILFIGRIETYKGVFDLLEIARRFKEKDLHDISFDFCGSGPFSDELQQEIMAMDLGKTCNYRGQCNREELKTLLSKSHVVIAPTRSTFIEGFCMVLAEGVLAGRPVISSEVCPGISYVEKAALKAIPDDIDSYEQCILNFYSNPRLYKEKADACISVSQQFYDPEKSLKAAMRKAIFLSVDNRLPP